MCFVRQYNPEWRKPLRHPAHEGYGGCGQGQCSQQAKPGVRLVTRELSRGQDAVILTSHSPDLTIAVRLDVVQMLGQRPWCVAFLSPIFNSSIYNSYPVSHRHCPWGVWEVVGSNQEASEGKIMGSNEKSWPRGIDTLRNPGLELAVKWPSKSILWAPILSTSGHTAFL